MRIIIYLLFLGFLIFGCGKNETVSESAFFERSLSEADLKKCQNMQEPIRMRKKNISAKK